MGSCETPGAGPAIEAYLDLAGEVTTRRVQLPGDRERVRQFAAISVMDHLRHRLLERAG